MIPPDALANGERAIVPVLRRRRYPNASFDVRDSAVGPLDDDVLLEAARCALGDDYAPQEACENLPTIDGLEALPQVDEGASNGKLRAAG